MYKRLQTNNGTKRFSQQDVKRNKRTSRTSKLRGLIGEMCKGTKELRGLVGETDVQRKKELSR